ncbi:MAG: hypothetical protein ACI4VF_10175 [Lachnospirales bacterium]
MKSIFFKIVCSIPFLILWGLYLLFFFTIYYMGGFDDIDYVFGKHIYIIIFIIAGLACTSIVYLRFFIKKEFRVQITAIIATIVSGIIIYGMVIYTKEVFSVFSTDKFINHPSHRLTMYFDLAERYDIKGYSYEQVEELLGKPDIPDDIYYTYLDGYGNNVSVVFENGKAVTFQYYYG